MDEKNIATAAQLGNGNAIAQVMNQTLQSLGISCQAKLIGDRLYIFVESLTVPHRQAVVSSLRQGMITLKVKSLKNVKIYARQLGENTAAWTEEIELITAAQSPVEVSDRSQASLKMESPSRAKTATIHKKSTKKVSKLFRNLERIFLILITFALTTIFWDRWGFLKPLNYPSEVTSLWNSWFSVANKRTATISGGSWVTKEAGSSDILRGLEIALCKASVKPELQRIRDNKWRESTVKNKTPIGYWHLNITAMNSKVSSQKDCIQVVRTGIEGKYTIPDVPFGSYFLYAPYETSVAKAYWMVPVEIKSTKPIQIDLDNSNMMELYNRE